MMTSFCRAIHMLVQISFVACLAPCWTAAPPRGLTSAGQRFPSRAEGVFTRRLFQVRLVTKVVGRGEARSTVRGGSLAQDFPSLFCLCFGLGLFLRMPLLGAPLPRNSSVYSFLLEVFINVLAIQGREFWNPSVCRLSSVV